MPIPPFGRGFHVSIPDLQAEFNRMVDRLWHSGISTPPFDGQDWAPLIDLIDEPGRYVLTAEVPGLSSEEIDTSFENGAVVLKGRKPATVGDDQERRFVCRERRSGEFCRRVVLAEPVDESAINATCRQGVLEVVLPKKTPATSRTVKIGIRDEG